MAAKQGFESVLTPRSPRSPFTAFALLAVCAAGLIAVASCDSQSPTAPDPPTSSSSSSSTVVSTSTSRSTSTSTRSTSSRNTTSTANTNCQDNLGTLHQGFQRRWSGVRLDGCFRESWFTTFGLNRASEVTIDMASSDFDTVLTLRQGTNNTSGSYLYRDDDGGSGTDSRIVARLEAGTYTIQQASFSELGGSVARFTVAIRVGTGTTTSRPTTTSRCTTTSRRTTTSAPTSTVVVFEIEDACYDGRRTELKFFAYDSPSNIAAVWPNDRQHYLLSDGGSNEYRLRAQGSWNVCYGARSENDTRGRYWGVGIDGNRGCSDCCRRAQEGRTVHHTGARLTC